MTLRILLLLVTLVLAPLAHAYDVTVTGSLYGAVWGSSPYTDDSNVAVAAVHAGLISPGQTATIRVSLLPGQSSYTGSTANGVTTYSYGAWGGSYTLSLVTSNSPPTAQLTIDSGVTWPSGQATAYTNAVIGITASTSDADGTVSSLVAYRDGYGVLASWSQGLSAYAGYTTFSAPSTPGTIQIRAEATDNAGALTYGNWHTISIVNPPSDHPPSADIVSESPVSLQVGQTFSRSISASDPNENLKEWRMTYGSTVGPWTSISGSSATGTASYTFSTAGTFAVTLDVKDYTGLTASETVYVNVSSAVNSLPYSLSSSYSTHVTYPSAAPNYAHLTDGLHNTGLGYGSDSGASNWLQADFGGLRQITQVHLGGGSIATWGMASQYSSGAVLEYSTNGTNWSVAQTFASGFAEGGTTIALNNLVGRYWRLSRSSWLGTTEFRFEGTTASAPNYVLTVQNGLTNGQPSASAPESTWLPISADTPQQGQLFNGWTQSGLGLLQDQGAANTQFQMGAGNATVTANFVANQAPTASISAPGNPTTAAIGSTLTFTYSATDANSNLSLWRVSLLPNTAQWTAISGASQSVQFNHTFNSTGVFTFLLEVQDTLGSTATASATITVGGVSVQ